MTMPNEARKAASAASAKARAEEPDSLPFPPDGYPALKSVPGASVLGYVVNPDAIVNDCIGPDGKIRLPGDLGFSRALHGSLGWFPMPKGWRFEKRKASVLYAWVDGNPILLEESAKDSGYPRAVAVQANLICLGEIT